MLRIGAFLLSISVTFVVAAPRSVVAQAAVPGYFFSQWTVKSNCIEQGFDPAEHDVTEPGSTESSAVVDDLLKKYLLHDHRAAIVSFLDLLNIPHSEGMIEENFDYATLTNERVQEAARSLLASADRKGSELYLKYLVLQGGPWAVIEEVLPAGE